MLFLIYINDLPTALNKLKSILYADESTVYASSPTLETLVNIVNAELTRQSVAVQREGGIPVGKKILYILIRAQM